MISTRAYSEILAILYSAPLDEPQWQVFLSQLCEVTGSRIATFLPKARLPPLARCLSGSLEL